MKLHLENTGSTLLITAIENDRVAINRQFYQGSIVVMPDKLIENWSSSLPNQLTEADFTFLAELGVPVVLLGTGLRQHFPSPRLLQPIAKGGVGLEVMDSAAACRTYNILASEGRPVAAALLFG